MKRRFVLASIACLLVLLTVAITPIPLGFFQHTTSSGSSDNPANYPLFAWWKADSYSLTNGAPIGGTGREWIDQSGNGHDAPVYGGVNPTYYTNGFNGLPSINFNGAELAMDGPSSTPGSNYTMIVVGRATIAGHVLFFSNSLTVNSQLGRYINTNMYVYEGGSTLFSDTLSSGVTNLVCYTWLKDTGTNYFFENTTARGSGVEPGTTDTFDVIGYAWDATLSKFDVGEIIITTNAMTSAQLTSLYDNYLKPRWGLP